MIAWHDGRRLSLGVYHRALGFAAALVALCLACETATAQQQQRRTGPAPRGTISGDIWLTPSVGVEYRIDQRWSFHMDAQLRFDQNVARLRHLEVRPGFEYSLGPQWALAAGYVQVTTYPERARPSRGPFQDLLYRGRIDGWLPITGRLRWEELFFEDHMVLVRTRALVGVRIPLGEGPWELALSDEVFINVNKDRPTRTTGFAQNRAFMGFGRPLTAFSKMAVGYELDTLNSRGTWRNVHNFKLNVIFSLN